MTEDEKKVAAEAEKLNGGGEKTTFTKEEVEAMKKDLQSNSEKGVQKVIAEKKNFQTAMGEISKVAEDKKHLVSLYDENPEVAKIILDTIYDGQDIDAFKEAIGYKEDLTDPKVIKKLVEKEAKQLSETQKISDAKIDFIKKLKLEGDELESFEESFAERQELKSFNANNVDKHLEKAFREISDDTDLLKELKKNKEIANTLATGGGKQGGNSKDITKNSVKEEAKSFVSTYL